jgi:predicted amidohydrolase
VRAAAIQLEARLADVDANLESAERLADRAGTAGAECIVLPEFFTTGIGFAPELADAALAPDGEGTELLRSLARRHGRWSAAPSSAVTPTARYATPSSSPIATARSPAATTRICRRCGRTPSTSGARTTA